jgi:hypothetical protein
MAVVLIVEDEDQVRVLAESYLQETGTKHAQQAPSPRRLPFSMAVSLSTYCSPVLA